MTRTIRDLAPQEQMRYDPTSAQHYTSPDQIADQKRRRKAAMRTARQAARLLRRDFGAHKVVLFGSLAAAERFLPWSDIDLAAWGIPAEQYFRAVAAVTGLSAEFKIDLVDPADCKPGLAAAIEHEGVELE